MTRILDLLAMSIGGWVGWTVGGWISISVAFFVSVVGTAAGLYASRRFADDYLP